MPLEEHVGPKELTADRQDRRIVPCDCFVWVGDAGASWPGGAHPLQATRNYRTAEVCAVQWIKKFRGMKSGVREADQIFTTLNEKHYRSKMRSSHNIFSERFATHFSSKPEY